MNRAAGLARNSTAGATSSGVPQRPMGVRSSGGLSRASTPFVVEIAELLDLAPAEIQDTLTFYDFFKQDKPHGEVRAWVCRSISCHLRDADELLEHMCERAGIRPGETTANGKLTLEFGECLGACEHAPCMLAGDTLHKSVTIEQADAFLEKLK